MPRQHRVPTAALCGALVLIALACTCGPLQTVLDTQSTLVAAQATLAPVLTGVEEQRPTLEAAFLTLQAEATVLPMTMTALGPQFAGTSTAVVATLSANASEISQWAVRATASSQYSDPEFSPAQATGAPNTAGCGDFGTAWASLAPNTVEWIRLEYDTPVIPFRVEIYETYSPGSITQVQVFDEQGTAYTIYQTRALPPQCPNVMTIQIAGIPVRVNAVLITVDQSLIGSWNEIDAVALVGLR